MNNWKERLDKQLKVGQKLYRIYYTNHFPYNGDKRHLAQHTITKIFKNHVQTFGRGYKIKKIDIGIDYHFTKEELYKHQLIKQKEAYDSLMLDSVNPMVKEINYLKKKIEEYSK